MNIQNSFVVNSVEIMGGTKGIMNILLPPDGERYDTWKAGTYVDSGVPVRKISLNTISGSDNSIPQKNSFNQQEHGGGITLIVDNIAFRDEFNIGDIYRMEMERVINK